MSYHVRSQQRIEPPEGGWLPHSFYEVEACFAQNNPISCYLFFTGFVVDNYPSNYNEFVCQEDHTTISDALYVKAIKLVYTMTEYRWRGMFIDLPAIVCDEGKEEEDA